VTDRPTKPKSPSKSGPRFLTKGNWRDLRPRILSAIVMVALGLGAVLSGHGAFRALVILAGVIGAWELVRMARHKGGQGGFAPGDVAALVGYFVILVFGCLGLLQLSSQGGRTLLLYIIGLVIVADSMGYLVGKTLGGPKFWPRISPKKTWSGILGGWIGVAILAAYAHQFMPEGFVRYWFFITSSVILAFASQLGDILESGLKRRMGIKDSSNIIPGHGGVLDRFDALLALGALAFLLTLLFG